MRKYENDGHASFSVTLDGPTSQSFCQSSLFFHSSLHPHQCKWLTWKRRHMSDSSSQLVLQGKDFSCFRFSLHLPLPSLISHCFLYKTATKRPLLVCVSSSSYFVCLSPWTKWLSLSLMPHSLLCFFLLILTVDLDVLDMNECTSHSYSSPSWSQEKQDNHGRTAPGFPLVCTLYTLYTHDHDQDCHYFRILYCLEFVGSVPSFDRRIGLSFKGLPSSSVSPSLFSSLPGKSTTCPSLLWFLCCLSLPFPSLSILFPLYFSSFLSLVHALKSMMRVVIPLTRRAGYILCSKSRESF